MIATTAASEHGQLRQRGSAVNMWPDIDEIKHHVKKVVHKIHNKCLSLV